MSKTKHSRAVIYARFSPRRNADECESCNLQIEYCTNYCEFNKLEIVGTFRDDGISGAKAENRPGLQDAMSQAMRQRAVLVVYSLSRLARNTRETLEIAERLNHAKANLASIKEKIDTTTAMGKFFFTVMAAMAEMERKQIAERTSDAMLRHQANGRRMSYRPPYGMKTDPENRSRLTMHPYEQKVIERILEIYETGAGSRVICRILTEEKFKPRKVARKVDGVFRYSLGIWRTPLIEKIVERAEAAQSH